MARFILGHWLGAWGLRSERVERALYWLDRGFFGLLLWLVRLLPVDTAVRFSGAVAATLGPHFKNNRALIDNLRIALPDRSDAELRRIGRECWANAGAVFAEFGHLHTISSAASPPRLLVNVDSAIETFRNPAKPCIFVIAHQANWELVGAAIVGKGVPLSCVYSPPTNPLLDEMLATWRGKIGCALLPSEDSMRPMLKALQQGRSLGLVMDRRVDSGKPVQFFGHDKWSTLVPARLALRFGCELVPARIERLHGARFRVSFMAPIQNDPAAGDEMAQALAMTRQVHALFEDWIRARPGQWLCTKRLWPKSVYANQTRTETRSSVIQAHAAPGENR